MGGGMEVQPGDTGWPSDLPMWGAGNLYHPANRDINHLSID
ncbi:hypothetical protein AB6G19_16420 [Providencia manganoxydans]